MGGRDKCWAFQSPSQIKSLVVDDKKEEGDNRIYEITLSLSDERVGGVYEAKATVTYKKVGKKWTFTCAGSGR